MIARNLYTQTVIIVACLLMSAPAAGNEIYVPDDYTMIQDAIDAAEDGDTILVRPGFYWEIFAFQGKAVEVRSLAGPESTIVEGSVYFVGEEGRDSILDGFTIQNSGMEDTGIYCSDTSPTIRNNIIMNHTDSGIICLYDESSPMILNNVIRDNTSTSLGGGLMTYNSNPVILGNTFINNRCISDHQLNGGGALCVGWHFSDVVIVRNQFIGNSSTQNGGAIYFVYGMVGATVTGNTFTGNSARIGGAITCSEPDAAAPPGDGLPLVLLGNNLFQGNIADYGSVIYDSGYTDFGIHNCTFVGNGRQALASRGTVTDSIFWNNVDPVILGEPEISWSLVEGGWPGEGNIDADPSFATGPAGEYYLSQTAAGQAADSPCVDAGSSPAQDSCYEIYEAMVCMDRFSTRTDLETDNGQVDMGYHYPDSPLPGSLFIAAGLGPHPSNPTTVHLLAPLQDARPLVEFESYSIQKYGVNISCGELDGEPGMEIITGPGPGAVFGPHVRGFMSDGTPNPLVSFLAYGTNKYGVNVAAGDVDNDGFDEILTGAGPGAVFGPHIRAFELDGGQEVVPLPGVSFFAYGTLKWGVNVAAGDLDGDGFDEIVSGAGPGAVFGPHVRGWNVDGWTAAAMPAVSFFAYGTPRYGVVVGCGDVDGDGMDEIVTAPGPSPAFGSHIRGWNYDGSTISELPGLSFFAWPAAEVRYGARVWAGTDLDADGRCEIIVGSGPGPANGSTVKVYDYQAGQVTLDFTLDAFPPVYTHGVNVAAGRF